ncbi:MAG TPA: matrixin family metalloprotease, partial [Burkholderiales bacterium]|nr:matrixin family metalloprotease [Burkholderiales bacterium]
AAGHGWFIDPTPYDDAEYAGHSPDGALKASASSPAYARMDLLSVVMHEIGHLLGFGHDDSVATTVMDQALATGTRVLSLDGFTASQGSLLEDAAPPPAPPAAPSDPSSTIPAAPGGPGRGRTRT